MKNKFKIVVIGLITAIILPACNSSLTITKRRASKGYYVDYSRVKQNSKAKDYVAEASVEKSIHLKTKSVEQVHVTTNPKSKHIQNFEHKQLITSTNESIEKPIVSKVKTEGKSNLHNLTVPNSEKKDQNKIMKLSQNKSISKIKAKMSPQPVEGALSLIWIVILVLLILWALGLLAGGWGLGGLINILLVIALILLILWLLRII